MKPDQLYCRQYPYTDTTCCPLTMCYILPVQIHVCTPFPDKLHSKLSPHGSHLGMSILNSTSQKGSPPRDRSYLLTSIPHLSQLEKLKVRNIFTNQGSPLTTDCMHVAFALLPNIYSPCRLPLHPRLNITDLYSQRHQLLS